MFARYNNKINFRTEILAGLTVAMTMIPESLSFAILAGLPPLMGLYAAFIMGLVTAVFGGRPGMISGGAGATIIVMIALIQSHGIPYLLAALILAGLIQLLVGIFKLGKFVRLIPQPVMYGFLNGLAVIIFTSQLNQFTSIQNGITTLLEGSTLYIMTGLTLVTVLIAVFFPKINKAFPASLMAIVVVFLLVLIFDIPTKTVGDIAAIKGGFPTFGIPNIPINFETFKIILPYALMMASVGLIETLLTLTMVDEMTASKGSANKESLAQGSANILNGFFGAMGGCAMVAQTLVNVNAGSRSRIAGVVGAVTILLIVLVGSPIIEKIPMAALVGVMMVVAVTTFKWVSFKLFKKMPVSDIFVCMLVTVLTVWLHNLAVAVFVGVIVSALVFAWDNAKRIRARKTISTEGYRVYEIYGPLFFGSVSNFNDKFDLDNDPEVIIVDFKESRIVDMSAIDCLSNLTLKYNEKNKKVILRYLSEDCQKLLENASGIIEVNIDKDPTYKVVPGN